MKTKIIKDSTLNIIATVFPIVLLQLFIYPIAANKMSTDDFGLMITLIGVCTLISFPLGNTLNNTRLLQNNEYEEETSGDFNILLLINCLFNILLVIVAAHYYVGQIWNIYTILLILVSVLNLLQTYLIVVFRIKIEYKKIIVNNFILGIGYLIGFILFNITGYWQLIYICGLAMSLTYIIRHFKFTREGLRKSDLFVKTATKSTMLLLSSFLRNLRVYLDRLLLLPLIGSEAVAVYYTATVIGKLFSIAVSPVSSVLLAYLVKIEKLRPRNLFKYVLLAIVAAPVIYFICLLIAEPLIQILYPKSADEAMSLVPITTASLVFSIYCTFLNPILLRFSNIKWQVWINAVLLVLNTILGILFIMHFGLFGYCISVAIVNAINLLIIIFSISLNFKRNLNCK